MHLQFIVQKPFCLTYCVGMTMKNGEKDIPDPVVFNGCCPHFKYVVIVSFCIEQISNYPLKNNKNYRWCKESISVIIVYCLLGTKDCQEKTLDTMKKMLYDTQGDDEWKKLLNRLYYTISTVSF